MVTTGKASEAVYAMTSTKTDWRSSGSTAYAPSAFSCLSSAYAVLGQRDEAERYIAKALTAMETTKETWCEADVLRAVGEITLTAPEPDAAKAQEYFERALAVARNKQGPGNSAPQRALRASGATRARCSKRANCLLRFTGGSRKDLTRLI